MSSFDLRAAWNGLCRLLKDDSYERYLREHARLAPEEPPLDPQAFRKKQILMTLGRRCCGG